MRSIAGSLARLINKTALSMAPVLLKSLMKKSASSVDDSHRTKDDSELLSCSPDLSLPSYLAAISACGKPDALKIGSLPSDKSVKTVYRRNTGLDELRQVVAGIWVDRDSIDVPALLSQEILGPPSRGLPNPSKDTTEHVK